MTFNQEGSELGVSRFSSVPAPVLDGGVSSSKALLAAVLASLDDAKAEDVVSIDVSRRTPVADHMVICSGRSQRHVGAIAEHLLKDIKDAGFGNAAVEGQTVCDWVLIDAGDVVVHVFRPEVRQFYHLEKIWADDSVTPAGRG